MMKLYKNSYSRWITFEPVGERNGRELEVSAFTKDVVFSVSGLEYIDRDARTVNPCEEYSLNLEETKALRDFLNEAIEAMENE